MKKKRGIAVLMALVLMVSASVSGAFVHESRAEAEPDLNVYNPVSEYVTRDTIAFGSYWQDEYTPERTISNPDDGGIYTDTDGTEMIYHAGSQKFFKKAPIRWQILWQEDTDLFLMADKAIDYQTYNYDGGSAKWDSCFLRTWLNETFYSGAFTTKEQSAIITNPVSNKDNSTYDTDGGEDTEDNIYLLSLDEIQNRKYQFHGDPLFWDQSRHAQMTDYVREQKNVIATNEAMDKTISWWLRTPGDRDGRQTYVDDAGGVGSQGCITNTFLGVRPVMHLDLTDDLAAAAYEERDTENVALKKTTWNAVHFGNYEGESLIWRVLSTDNNEALLLLDHSLEKKAYKASGVEKTDDNGNSYTDYSCTWETSDIRSWLNDEFYSAAFSEEEQNNIISADLGNSDEKEDDVFLLSTADVTNAEYGFPSAYSCYSASRTVLPADKSSKKFWWLRTQGNSECLVSNVGTQGQVRWYGDEVNTGYNVVRPALRLNLHSMAWFKANSITADDSESYQYVETPVSSPDPTPESTDSPTAAPTDEPAVVPGSNERWNKIATQPILSWVFNSPTENGLQLTGATVEDGVLTLGTKTGRMHKTYAGLPSLTSFDFSHGLTVTMDVNVTDYSTNQEWSRLFLFGNGTPGGGIQDGVVSFGFTPVFHSILDHDDFTHKTGYLGVGAVFIEGNMSEDYTAAPLGSNRMPLVWNWYSEENKRNRWDCITITVSEDGTMTTYFDGIKVQSYQDESFKNILEAMKRAHSNYLGTSYYPDPDFVGQLDNFAIYNTALSAEDVEKIGEIDRKTESTELPVESPAAPVETEPDPDASAESSVSPSAVVPVDNTKEPPAPASTSTPVPASTVTPSGNPDASTTETPQVKQTESPTAAATPTSAPTAAATQTPESGSTSQEDTGVAVRTPARVKSVTIKNQKKGKTVISYKKVSSAAGYQIQCAANKKFTKGKKSYTTKKTTYTIKKLKKKKTYYFRVRAYTKDSDGKNVYGKWSAVKKLKIKK